MADGYLSQSQTNTEGMSLEAMLYCKTNIGGYFFDGFLEVGLNSSLTVTSNPTDEGSSISDHAYLNPREITMNVVMSDVHQSLIPGQFSERYSRSISAYGILSEIQKKRIPVSVHCRLGLFHNMLISNLSAVDNSDTLYGLNANVTLIELPVARVRTVEISQASQTTINSEMGKIQAVDTNDKEDESILYQLGFGAGANQ